MEEQIKKSNISKKITSDLFWSFGAVILLNGIIQLAVYPFLQRRLGVAGYGDMLYQLSLITILGAGVGMATNNYRLLKQNDENLANGDYLFCLFSMLLFGCIIIAIITHSEFSAFQLLAYLVLAVFIGLRYYSDVAYRLTLNYRRYFFFYLILSAGYLIGIALWQIINSWIIVILLGEIACIIYCMFNGGIYYPIKKKSSFWKTEKQILLLAASYLLYNGVIQMDRVLLKNLLGSEAVSIYYVASLLGKILALVVGPLNAVLLSYLSKMNEKLNQKVVLIIVSSVIGVSGICFLGISIIAPWVTKTLYPDIDCGNLLLLANLGQILCFAGSLILTVLLTMAPSYWQLISQGVYAVVFVVFGQWGAAYNGLEGFIIGTLYANVIRFVISIAALIIAVKKGTLHKTAEK